MKCKASMMTVVLGIRPLKMAYIDKSNDSPVLAGGGGGNVFIILLTHLFLHTTYLAKSFKFCINLIYVYKYMVSIILHVCDIALFTFYSACL